jgi:rod shape-determining protein MreD
MIRRILLTPLLLIVAVTGQLAVVNRMPLPGGGGTPDLVLLVVAALGVTAGPMTGLLAGFAGGLALDVAPPGGHLAGEYALIFCLVGYACGRIRELIQGPSAERSAITSLIVMAFGVVAGEAGKVALGRMVSDPNLTGLAIRHVLPAAVVYDLLLCPFAAWLVALVVGAPVAEHAPQVQFPQAFRWSPAFRLASAGAPSGLRLAGSSAPLVPPPIRSEPRLRLASGRSAFLSGTNSAFSTARPAVSGGRQAKLNFSSSGASALRAIGAANFQGKSPPKGWLRPGKPIGNAARRPAEPGKGFARGRAPATPVRRPGSLGKGWARGDLPTAPVRRPNSPPKGWVRPARSAPAQLSTWRQHSPAKGFARGPRLGTGSPARRAGSPGKGWARTGLPAAPDSWRRQSPGKGWARTGLPPGLDSWRRRSPGKGWLQAAKAPAAPRTKSPGKGWLRAAKPAQAPRRKSPGKGWLRVTKPPKQNWYTRSPSTRWLKRGRRRRLLLGGRK